MTSQSPLGERLSDIVTQLLSSPESPDHVVTSVLCPNCNQSWRLRLEEDVQFLHAHRRGSVLCKPNSVVRIIADRIGESQYEREERKTSWRRRLAGYLRIPGEAK